MADAIISELTTAVALALTDLYETEQGVTPDNHSKKVALSQMLAMVKGPWFNYTADTGSISDSAPASGLFKWNNAVQASATKLFFANATNDGTSVAALLTELLASSPIGIVNITDAAGNFQIFKWTAVTIASGYYKLDVTNLVSSASLVDEASCRILLLPMPQQFVDAPSNGSTYGRKNGAWAAVAGGSSGWQTITSWSFAVNGAVASIEGDISGFSEVFLGVKDVTLAASGYRGFQISVNAGSSYITSYDYVPSTGIRATSSNSFCALHTSAASALRSASGRFPLFSDFDMDVWGPEALSNAMFFLSAGGSVPNKVKLGGWTGAGAPTNMTGGSAIIKAR